MNAVLQNDDLYLILGIPKSQHIDKTTLRRAYLSRSKACHPEYATIFKFTIATLLLIVSQIVNSQTTQKPRMPSRK